MAATRGAATMMMMTTVTMAPRCFSLFKISRRVGASGVGVGYGYWRSKGEEVEVRVERKKMGKGWWVGKKKKGVRR
jgi:hypothetical protein